MRAFQNRAAPEERKPQAKPGGMRRSHAVGGGEGIASFAVRRIDNRFPSRSERRVSGYVFGRQLIEKRGLAPHFSRARWRVWQNAT